MRITAKGQVTIPQAIREKLGLHPATEVEFEIEEGKTLILKLVAIGEADAEGQRTVFFEVNGQPREVTSEPSTTTGASTKRAPANSRSGRIPG